jgi:hypothetical protein
VCKLLTAADRVADTVTTATVRGPRGPGTRRPSHTVAIRQPHLPDHNVRAESSFKLKGHETLRTGSTAA